VVVCDGFVGNITLKASEGVAELVAQYTKEAFQSTWWAKLAALPAIPILKRLVKRINPERHNGATLLGLNGIVIKSHGRAKAMAFAYAIEEAIVEVDKNILQLIKDRVGMILEGGSENK
jgi:glycerol-3-phosphate acyltransferase PlsX